jgi:hypothetical protein
VKTVFSYFLKGAEQNQATMSDIWPIDQDLMSGTPKRKNKLSRNVAVDAANPYKTLEARSDMKTRRIVHQNGITWLQ